MEVVDFDFAEFQLVFIELKDLIDSFDSNTVIKDAVYRKVYYSYQLQTYIEIFPEDQIHYSSLLLQKNLHGKIHKLETLKISMFMSECSINISSDSFTVVKLVNGLWNIRYFDDKDDILFKTTINIKDVREIRKTT